MEVCAADPTRRVRRQFGDGDERIDFAFLFICFVSCYLLVLSLWAAGRMASPVRLFEPTDLLSFDEAPPTPPRSNQSDILTVNDKVVEVRSISLEMEIDLDIPPATSRQRIMDDSPPPDMEEEPSDFEDEVRATLDRSQEDRVSLPPSSLPQTVPTFGASDLLDFDMPKQDSMPIASCQLP